MEIFSMAFAVSFLAYLIFVFDFYFTLEYRMTLYKVEYTGLLWVGLDYWTIWKYNSKDTPMKWVKYSAIKL